MDKEELRKRMSKAIGTFENQMVRNITETCAEIAVNYFTEQKLNIASVVRPEVEGAKEGELLPAEAFGKSVSAGPCCCNNTTLGQTECDGLCVDIDEYD